MSDQIPMPVVEESDIETKRKLEPWIITIIAVAIAIASVGGYLFSKTNESDRSPKYVAFHTLVNDLCPGVESLDQQYQAGSIDNQQLYDQLIPLMKSGYAHFPLEYTGGISMSSTLDAVTPMFINILLTAQVQFCKSAKGNGY